MFNEYICTIISTPHSNRLNDFCLVNLVRKNIQFVKWGHFPNLPATHNVKYE